jgi:hypothetical protein
VSVSVAWRSKPLRVDNYVRLPGRVLKRGSRFARGYIAVQCSGQRDGGPVAHWAVNWPIVIHQDLGGALERIYVDDPPGFSPDRNDYRRGEPVSLSHSRMIGQPA